MSKMSIIAIEVNLRVSVVAGSLRFFEIGSSSSRAAMD
jgi:hypothetical protein